MADRITYVGLDVHKESIVVAVASGGLRGEVREYGRIANTATALDRLLRKLGGDGMKLRFVTRMGSFRRAVPVSLNSLDPAARRCTVASTGGPAMYFIGIDVSTKESALCILDGNDKIVRETKLPTCNEPQSSAAGSQSSADRAQNHCNGSEGSDPQSLQLGP